MKEKKNIVEANLSSTGILERELERESNMITRKRGINTVPSHIYRAIKEYHLKGYDREKLIGLIKKEFPGQIKITDKAFKAVVYSVIYHYDRKSKQEMEKILKHGHSGVPVTSDSSSTPVDNLGLFPTLDGTEEVSNVRPSVYKPSEMAMDSIVNWKLNNIATVTTKNGVVITIEFSDKTLTDLIRNTLG